VPLVLDPERLSKATLQELVRSLRQDLEEARELALHPRGRVLDPASLTTAVELADGAIAALDRPGPRERRALASDANLAYATMLAIVDLVKSHTDVPRVPKQRPKPA
jgi:hypothetical protein